MPKQRAYVMLCTTENPALDVMCAFYCGFAAELWLLQLHSENTDSHCLGSSFPPQWISVETAGLTVI